MKSRLFTSEIKDGGLNPIIERDLFNHLEKYEGKKVTIEVKDFVRTRTSSQNRYMWGCLYPNYIQAMLDTGDDSAVEYSKKNRIPKVTDAIHEILLQELGNRELLNKETGELIFIPSRTSSMNTIEINTYIDNIRDMAAQRYGYYIPLPSEYNPKF